MSAGDFRRLEEEISAFVEGRAEEIAAALEEGETDSGEVREELRRRGYLNLAAPRELGGAGVPFSRYVELVELFGRTHGTIRTIVHVANGIWRAVDGRATGEQRERFVRPLVAGEVTAAFTMSEPDSGAGADLKTSVRRDGEVYLLSGEKHMITFGLTADYLLTFARLEGTAGAEGTVALMVPRDAPGVEARPMPPAMGLRGTDYARVSFREVPIPLENRLGEEGEGLAVAFEGFLAPSRIAVAASCVGLAERALELAVDHARGRVTFGRPLAARQAVQHTLAEMATEVEAARHLVRWAASRWETGEGGLVASSKAKLFATGMLQRVTDGALQVHGGVGYFASPIERIYRDARVQRFEEGTAEVQKALIARELLGKEGS
ncbi:acyl-CoA dehydrogenase family protein [Rubrobacter naiadicus]|uniref:acyl-CoA dehydrogenase family protein n=1 Tax=Rubrobacter naiadicus TaxID=1392641 RepID=UPI002360104F|nr:acyl-CoA dehydrogenase family protein [Rubrobacter naiadicus]